MREQCHQGGRARGPEEPSGEKMPPTLGQGWGAHRAIFSQDLGFYITERQRRDTFASPLLREYRFEK